VLARVNLVLNPCEVIALVGENGSSKTTLIKLLCLLYDPDDGAITLNGIDLRDFDPVAWRKELSVIFQDYVHQTNLGHWFSGGQELSEDKWQKIALARAFFRDSKIVILDESTSSLDPLAEAELFRNFRNLLEGRSAVIISQHYSAVQMADRIYLLDKGIIIEQGSHEEILRLNGRYSFLFRTQAEHYQINPAKSKAE
jgi:ATP-binding cassette, subfamily B, bacterial